MASRTEQCPAMGRWPFEDEFSLLAPIVAEIGSRPTTITQNIVVIENEVMNEWSE